MELKEFDDAVLQSPNKDWFIERTVYSFPIRSSTGLLTKKGLISIYRYVIDQIIGFKEYGENLPAELNSSLAYFETLRDDIVSFFSTSHSHGPQQLESQWNQLVLRLTQRLQRDGNKLMDFDSAEANFLVSLKKENASYVFAALQFFCNESISNPDRPENLIGAIKAYNYKFEEKSGVGLRKNNEKISLGLLRSSFQKVLDEIESNHLKHVGSEIEKAKEFSKSIDTLKETKEKLFDEWYSLSTDKFVKLSKNIEDRKEEMEKTYGEQLRLKKPAEYWQTRAITLGKEGNTFLRWIYVLIGIGALSLFVLLWQIPDGMLLKIFNGDANAIKWTIVYVTFISFLAFGIKTLSKLTYSTYHLKRDAEERYQLTLVYLSLTNESKVEEKDRQLILQSLFSRADSGLLKDDSSPTMPGLIESVFKSK